MLHEDLMMRGVKCTGRVIDGIVAMIESQVEQAKAALIDKKGVLRQLKAVARRGECKWRDVKSVELKSMRLYIVRRIFGGYLRDLPPSDPCVYRWTEHGWSRYQGVLPESCGQGATIQVLC